MEDIENNKAKLQEIRRKEIPTTIEKYKALVDGIFEQVAEKFPTFKDINLSNEEDEGGKTITAEEQLYSFMLMREKAIDHADRMLNKINNLELELNNPEVFELLNKEEITGKSETKVPINPAKKHVRKQ